MSDHIISSGDRMTGHKQKIPFDLNFEDLGLRFLEKDEIARLLEADRLQPLAEQLLREVGLPRLTLGQRKRLLQLPPAGCHEIKEHVKHAKPDLRCLKCGGLRMKDPEGRYIGCRNSKSNRFVFSELSSAIPPH